MGGPLIPHSSWAGSLESTPDTCVAEAYQGNELGSHILGEWAGGSHLGEVDWGANLSGEWTGGSLASRAGNLYPRTETLAFSGSQDKLKIYFGTLQESVLNFTTESPVLTSYLSVPQM